MLATSRVATSRAAGISRSAATSRAVESTRRALRSRARAITATNQVTSATRVQSSRANTQLTTKDKQEQGSNRKPESLNIVQHKLCFQLDGAVTADQVEAKGTYRLCATHVVSGQSEADKCVQQAGADSEEEDDNDEPPALEIQRSEDTGGGREGNATRRRGDATQRRRVRARAGPVVIQQPGRRGTFGSSSGSASKMLHAIQSDIVDKDDFNISQVQDKTLLLLSAPGGEELAIIDNACMHSVTNRLDMLTNIRKRVISFEGLGKGSAQYVGDAVFKVHTVHGNLLLILESMTMAYMLDLNKTILLFHHLKEHGWWTNLLAGDMQIGEQRVQLINEGRLDYVDIFPAGDSTEERLLLLENAHNVLSKTVVELQEA